MKLMSKLFVAILIVMILQACSSSSGGSSGGSDAARDGFDAFKDQDISTAQTEYCDGLASDATDSELAFGCFWATLLLLPESTEADSILAVFDESPIDVETDLFGTGGILSDLTAVHGSFPFFNYMDFNLPFVDLFAANDGSISEQLEELVSLAHANGYSAGDIVEILDDFITKFETLESYLEVVLDDTGFTYTLPMELFGLSEDVGVTYTDAQLFMATVKMTIVNINFIQAYDYGVDFGDVLDGSGRIDQEIFVADLNGSGETVNSVTVDTTVFLTLLDGSLITDSETRFVDALELAKTAFESILSGTDSNFFPPNISDVESEVEFVDDLIASTSGMTEVSRPDLTINLNLREFFDNPPDASTLDAASGDPFVFEDGKAQYVESYFSDLLDGIVEF